MNYNYFYKNSLINNIIVYIVFVYYISYYNYNINIKNFFFLKNFKLELINGLLLIHPVLTLVSYIFNLNCINNNINIKFIFKYKCNVVNNKYYYTLFYITIITIFLGS